MADIENTAKCKSWFCVWNNPQETLEGEPSEIAEKALEMWISDKLTRTGAVAYCISAEGLHHLHMVLEDSHQARFSTLKNTYPKAHLEPTKGNKEQAEDYIQKKGKWEEKGEQVLYTARFGEIKGRQGQRKDLEIIEDMLQKGMNPRQIMEQNLSYRKFDRMIKDAYYAKRSRETLFLREVKVYWHVGSSGSGKSYTANKLVEQYGEDEVYFLTDYENGGFDGYCGEKILFMDEFRGQIRFSTLLGYLQGYKQQVHARFTNVIGLWDEVHITSPLAPEMVYENMVSNNKKVDSVKQLLRRITEVIYHYKDRDGYHEFHCPAEKYKDYENLISAAITPDWITETEQIKIPFN